MKKYLLAVFLMTLFASCLEKADLNSLNGTKWVLTEMPGRSLPANGQATLNIDGDKIGGKAFCNGYGGTVVTDGKKIRAEQIISTKMFCEQLSSYEQDYIRALERMTGIQKDGDKLVALAGTERLLVFSPAR